MIPEVAQACGYAVAVQIGLACKQAEPEFADPLRDQAGSRRLEERNEKVGLALVDIDRLRRGDELHGQLRRGAAQIGETLCQIERGDPLHCGEAHRSDQGLGVAGAGFLANGDHRALDPLGMAQQPLTDLVELEARAVTLEHSDPERRLHLGDPPADRGMVEPQPLGGLAEISGAGGVEKYA